MPRGDHLHTDTGELHGFWVPADPEVPCEMKVINSDWRSIVDFLGGYVAVAREGHHFPWPLMPCSCSMVMLVDEEGLLKRLPLNPRATLMHPHDPIVGEALFVLEGPGIEGISWFSLPEFFKNWEGPGKPVPLG